MALTAFHLKEEVINHFRVIDLSNKKMSNGHVRQWRHDIL